MRDKCLRCSTELRMAGAPCVACQAHDLTFGMLATLTGKRRYDEAQEIQEDFVHHCAENYDSYKNWREAWREFWPDEEAACRSCGSEDKSDDQDFCDDCNARGDATAAHYGG